MSVSTGGRRTLEAERRSARRCSNGAAVDRRAAQPRRLARARRPRAPDLAAGLRPARPVAAARSRPSLATSVVTAIWTIGLRAALSTYFTLGPAVASAAGTVMGLVAISALDLWVRASSSGRRALAETAIAVFALSAAWEHVVRSIAKRRVLVVGHGRVRLARCSSELKNGHHAPFTMLGLVGEARRRPPRDVPRLGSFERALADRRGAAARHRDPDRRAGGRLGGRSAARPRAGRLPRRRRLALHRARPRARSAAAT